MLSINICDTVKNLKIRTPKIITVIDKNKKEEFGF